MSQGTGGRPTTMSQGTCVRPTGVAVTDCNLFEKTVQ